MVFRHGGRAGGDSKPADRRDELGAIRVCRAYVEAQREYAGEPRQGGEVLDYATICAARPTP